LRIFRGASGQAGEEISKEITLNEKRRKGIGDEESATRVLSVYIVRPAGRPIARPDFPLGH